MRLSSTVSAWLGGSNTADHIDLRWLSDHAQVSVPVSWWTGSEVLTSAGEEMCLVMNSDSDLDVLPCWEAFKYICQISKLVISNQRFCKYGKISQLSIFCVHSPPGG